MCWHRSKSRSPVHLNSVVIVNPLKNCSSPNGQWSSNWQVLRCCFYIFLHISTCFYMFPPLATPTPGSAWPMETNRESTTRKFTSAAKFTVQPPGCGKCWDNEQKLRYNNIYIIIYIYTHVIYSNYIYKCYYSTGECRTNQNWTWHEAAKKQLLCVFSDSHTLLVSFGCNKPPGWSSMVFIKLEHWVATSCPKAISWEAQRHLAVHYEEEFQTALHLGLDAKTRRTSMDMEIHEIVQG